MPLSYMAPFLVSRVETNLIVCIPFEQEGDCVGDTINSR